MANSEDIEKIRQEIMRLRELLNLMRRRQENGERAYQRLFSRCSPEQMKTMKEKDLQRLVAEQMDGDLSAIREAVGQLRFDSRELERAFEELYDIIVSAESSAP